MVNSTNPEKFPLPYFYPEILCLSRALSITNINQKKPRKQAFPTWIYSCVKPALSQGKIRLFQHGCLRKEVKRTCLLNKKNKTLKTVA